MVCHTGNWDIRFTSSGAVGRFLWCLPAEEHSAGNKCEVTVKDFYSKNEAFQKIPSASLLIITEGFFLNKKYFQQHGAVIHSQCPLFCCE